MRFVQACAAGASESTRRGSECTVGMHGGLGGQRAGVPADA